MQEEDDYSHATKQRATREEVRRRNKEVMEKANAEFRDSKTVVPAATKPAGKKDYSRLGLIQKFRDGVQSFYCDYRFHNSTPELECGVLREEVELDASKFVNFDTSSASQLFNDCLRNTCLIEESSVVYLDLVNPEETYARVSVMDRADECLLSNEVSVNDSREDATVYTGHFLRRPQLMSNDLFTEGDRSGSTNNRKYANAVPQELDEVDDEFEQVAMIDEQYKLGQSIENKVTRSQQRIKRVLTILPDTELGEGQYIQVKFDEPYVRNAFESVMTNDFEMYEQGDDCYVKKQKFIHGNKSTSSSEEFYLVRIPAESSLCFIKQLGNKILLKKDTSLEVDRISDTKIKLITRD